MRPPCISLFSSHTIIECTRNIYIGLHCQTFMPISNNFAQNDSIWKIKEHSSLLDMILFRQMLHCGYLEADGCPIQYIPRNMHTVFALLCFVVVIHWLVFPYPSGLLQWHCGNLTIAPMPAKQPWWIWINTSCEFIMNDCITTTKQSTTKPCAYFLGYTVYSSANLAIVGSGNCLLLDPPCHSLYQWQFVIAVLQLPCQCNSVRNAQVINQWNIIIRHNKKNIYQEARR